MENLIFSLVERGFGWNLIRNIFATLDSVAFFLFAKVMGLMFEIADVTASADLNSVLKPLQSRIYVILSIYMLFKVTISLITYVVNPDTMTDKSQGVGKLVQRIIVALVMLIFFPYAFDFANDLQSDLIKNNTVGKIVLGSSGSFSDPDGIGNEIAFSVYNGTFIYVSDTHESIAGVSPATVDSLVQLVNEPMDNNNSQYKYGYLPLAGFAVGVVLTILTLSMCIDVAMRVFKLIILQLVAPIPILSYIDPKSSKDGAFSAWLKMTAKVWMEVFLRLFVIYFILLVIEKLINNGANIFGQTSVFVKIALVIGLLFFAKDAPKFIANAIGIKNLPERGLFAGMGNILAAGAIAGGALGTGVAIARSGFTRDSANGKLGPGSAIRNLGAGLFGAAGSLASGAYAAGTAKDKQAKAAMDARNKYLANKLSGNTLGAKLSTGAQNLILGYDIDREIAQASAIEATAEKLRGYANGEGAKKFSDVNSSFTYMDSMGIEQTISMSRNDLQLGIADASNHGGHVVVNGIDLGAANGSIVGKLSGDVDEFVGDKYMDEVHSGSITDPGALAALTSSYASAVGIKVDEAKTHRNSTIKKNQKSNGTRKFTLQQKKGGK